MGKLVVPDEDVRARLLLLLWSQDEAGSCLAAICTCDYRYMLEECKKVTTKRERETHIQQINA